MYGALMHRTTTWVAISICLTAGCGDDAGHEGDAGPEEVDAGDAAADVSVATRDASGMRDVGGEAMPDATIDAADAHADGLDASDDSAADAVADAAPDVTPDAWDSQVDSTVGDADAESGDAGPEDAGSFDTGPADAGPQDSGPADAGPQDSGPADPLMAQIVVECETLGFAGSVSIVVNGELVCTREGAGVASGELDFVCTPGSTVSVAGSCTSGPCRARVPAATNLVCPDAPDWIEGGGFGGAAGFDNTIASVSCTCQD